MRNSQTLNRSSSRSPFRFNIELPTMLIIIKKLRYEIESFFPKFIEKDHWDHAFHDCHFRIFNSLQTFVEILLFLLWLNFSSNLIFYFSIFSFLWRNPKYSRCEIDDFWTNIYPSLSLKMKKKVLILQHYFFMYAIANI
jgi:hypothetical protein